MMAKPWYKSKTVWANILIGAAGIIDLALELEGTYDFIPNSLIPFLMLGAATINLILRFVTSQPIKSRLHPDSIPNI